MHINIKRFFEDKDGKIVIGQTPNPPLLISIAFLILGFLLSNTGLQTLGYGFLLVWAYLELSDGACAFRKVLGAIVLLCVVILLLYS